VPAGLTVTGMAIGMLIGIGLTTPTMTVE